MKYSEEIPKSVLRERERKALDEAVCRFYNSLSSAEVHEQMEWGCFAEREFRIEEGFQLHES